MSLLEQLQQRAAARQGEKARKGAGLQLFVAQKDEIAEAVAARWPLKEIHALLQEQGRMPVTYRVFCGNDKPIICCSVRITSHIKLGIRTDREQTIQDKIDSVQEKLAAG